MDVQIVRQLSKDWCSWQLPKLFNGLCRCPCNSFVGGLLACRAYAQQVEGPINGTSWLVGAGVLQASPASVQQLPKLVTGLSKLVD